MLKYYILIASQTGDGASPLNGQIEMKNVAESRTVSAASICCVDALALVRFGLRAADDPRIVES